MGTVACTKLVGAIGDIKSPERRSIARDEISVAELQNGKNLHISQTTMADIFKVKFRLLKKNSSTIFCSC